MTYFKFVKVFLRNQVLILRYYIMYLRKFLIVMIYKIVWCSIARDFVFFSASHSDSGVLHINTRSKHCLTVANVISSPFSLLLRPSPPPRLPQRLNHNPSLPAWLSLFWSRLYWVSEVFIREKLQRIGALIKDGGGRPAGMKGKSSSFQIYEVNLAGTF